MRRVTGSIDVALLPSELTPERLSGRTAVVIDVLRFSTTVVAAFEAGARSARPVAELDDAVALLARGEADLCCGERGGRKPEGFHLGNSPLEYTRTAVAGRRLACTTTNGTRALLACAVARRVLVGCFRNSGPLVAALAGWADGVTLVCAGTGGRFSLEDALAAGVLVDRLCQGGSVGLTDGAVAARELHRATADDVAAALAATDHGCALAALGFADDVRFAAVANPSAPVPLWDPELRSLIVSPAA